jgi:hypothetical protein
MTQLPDFRRTRPRSGGVRLVPITDLRNLHATLWAVLIVQLIILIGMML